MTSTGLLRPHSPSFAAVVVLQVIGAIAGLAPLLAVVELGRTLLSSGPIGHGHVWTAVAVGAAGLFVRLMVTAASGLGIFSTTGCNWPSAAGWPSGWGACRSAGSPGAGPASWPRWWGMT